MKKLLMNLFVAWALLNTPHFAAAQNGVDAVAMTVSNMEVILPFYTQVLPFKIVSDAEVAGDEYERLLGVFGARVRIVRLQLGTEFIELIDYLAPEGRPIPVDSKSNDLWFQHIAIIVSDMSKAYAHLRKHNVQHASTGPQRLPDWNVNAGGIEAFYFRDPDGHHLEILAFPAGKGDSRWHHRTGDLFLGIDHTAIVVEDTETSLRFYRDTLGMRVVGNSENYGVEQERLNNVFGARLRITTLHADDGPGVELLEYLAPAGGRAATDVRGNDLVRWHTVVASAEPDKLLQAVRRVGSDLISTWVELPAAPLDIEGGFIVLDPDLHAVRVVSRRQVAAHQ